MNIKFKGLMWLALMLLVMCVVTAPVKAQEKNVKNQEQENKEIVGKWLDNFWGPHYNPAIVDELASKEMVLQYSLHQPRLGHADIKDFMKKFRAAFPDLAFAGAYPLLADGEYVIARWVGGGTHTGAAFSDWPVGALPAATGRKMHFTGTTVFRVVNGKVTEEIGLDDGLTTLLQLELVRPVK
ncbi:MAG: ester cyclase [Cyclobacteriaceae bacterium]|nr:ester cyclase [Cyclobacteriaceae bacterium]